LAGLSAGVAEAERRLRLELEDEAAMRVDMAGAWLAAKPLPCFCEQRFEPPAHRGK
jgi:hypothetical protein